MLFFLIFIKIIYIKSYKEILIDKLFNELEVNTINMNNCTCYDEDTFFYRGRLINIKDIIDKNNLNLLLLTVRYLIWFLFFVNENNNYKYVFIPESKYLNNVTLFPKSTVFFPLEGIIKYGEKFNKDYCFITIKYNIEKYKDFYYIIIGNELDKKTEKLALCIIKTLYIFVLIFSLVSSWRVCFLPINYHIHIYNLARVIPHLLIIIDVSYMIINSFLLFHLIYTLYKSFYCINLLFLIDGFNIIDQKKRLSPLLKTFLYFFLYNEITTIILLYISYFLPSINNSFLFILKNIVENLILLYI